jgi:hypothetical protein
MNIELTGVGPTDLLGFAMALVLVVRGIQSRKSPAIMSWSVTDARKAFARLFRR